MPGSYTNKMMLLAVLAALTVGIQVAPRPPNLEFTSLIVFLVGALFGTTLGVGIGIFAMVFNSFFSPWGFAGLMLPFQVMGMMIFGIVGGFYGRSVDGGYKSRSCVETAILGAFLTLVYDIITNFGFATFLMFFGSSFSAAISSSIISGALFSLTHVISNTLVFGIAFFPLARAIQRMLEETILWKKEQSPM